MHPGPHRVAKVASISTATTPAVTARLTSSGPQLTSSSPSIRSLNASTGHPELARLAASALGQQGSQLTGARRSGPFGSRTVPHSTTDARRSRPPPVTMYSPFSRHSALASAVSTGATASGSMRFLAADGIPSSVIWVSAYGSSMLVSTPLAAPSAASDRPNASRPPLLAA